MFDLKMFNKSKIHFSEKVKGKAENPFEADKGIHLAYTYGLLTAIAVGPEIVLPEEWLNVVTRSASIHWKSELQKHAAQKHLTQAYNQIAQAVNNNEPFATSIYFAPLNNPQLESEERLALIMRWCDGFMKGINFNTSGWNELLESERCDLISPFSDTSQENFAENFPNKELGPRQHSLILMLLANNIKAINAFWFDKSECVLSGVFDNGLEFALN
ncbi:MAG: UPF0149 family protein [Pseudomonadota bacterium]